MAVAERVGVGGWWLRLAGWGDTLRSSLFFVPSCWVVASVGAGFAGTYGDAQLIRRPVQFPLGFVSTVESARAVLATVAGATMTVAGVAFSIALLVFQLASSQYSPRVVQGLFRDRFNKHVMGLVVGTFSFCLVVLRGVHAPTGDGREAAVPTVSVSVAVVAGILSVLATLAFIDRSAHLMDVSRLLRDVSAQTSGRVGSTWTGRGDAGPDAGGAGELGAGGLRIDLDRDGWVQRIDAAILLRAVDPGTTVRLEVRVGRFGLAGTPLCTVWPPVGPDRRAELERGVRRAVTVGATRTVEQDAAYGLRQLVDVALRALSPGVNDPTTAQDAIFHAAGVLRAMLSRFPPPVGAADDDGRRLVEAHPVTGEELVRLTFAEVRRAAAGQPAVCAYLLEAMHLVLVGVDWDPGDGDAGAARRALEQEAAAVVVGCERAGPLASDLTWVRGVHREAFAGAGIPG